MIALLLLWRFKAWIGVKWRMLKGRKVRGELRWQDKTGAVGVGVLLSLSEPLTASHAIFRLARFTIIGSFLPISALSPRQS